MNFIAMGRLALVGKWVMFRLKLPISIGNCNELDGRPEVHLFPGHGFLK